MEHPPIPLPSGGLWQTGSPGFALLPLSLGWPCGIPVAATPLPGPESSPAVTSEQRLPPALQPGGAPFCLFPRHRPATSPHMLRARCLAAPGSPDTGPVWSEATLRLLLSQCILSPLCFSSLPPSSLSCPLPPSSVFCIKAPCTSFPLCPAVWLPVQLLSFLSS